MKTSKKSFTTKSLVALISVVVLTGLIVTGSLAAAPWAVDVSDLPYSVGSGWQYLDDDVTIEPAGVNNFNGGYIEVDINDAASTDELQLLGEGDLTVDGTSVLWQHDEIGVIDATRNGQGGQPLRINFFSSSLPNADFEIGMTGWISDTNYSGVNGEAWVQRTTGDSDPAIDDHDGITQEATIQSDTVYDGSSALKLNISGTVGEGYGTAHGPELTSAAPFTAAAGDIISLNWNAQHGGDDYDVYAFVDNSNDPAGYQLLFYEAGQTTNGWKTSRATLDHGGSSLELRFLAGTYDRSGGKYVGATLYLDGIQIASASTVYSSTVMEAIFEQIQYQNTSGELEPTKLYDINFQDFVGATGQTSAVQIISELNKATTAALMSSQNPVIEGRPVTFVATVSSAEGTPTGVVAFYDGDDIMATRTLTNGQASYTPAYSLFKGIHYITAKYQGDDENSFNPSTSPVLEQEIVRGTDLEVSKTLDIAYPGVVFTIVVNNNDCPCCIPADGAVVSDVMHSSLRDVTWTCVTSGGASCTPSGTGNISDTLGSFPTGGVVTYTVNAMATEDFTNTVEVIPAAFYYDAIPANNTASVSGYYVRMPLVFR